MRYYKATKRAENSHAVLQYLQPSGNIITPKQQLYNQTISHYLLIIFSQFIPLQTQKDILSHRHEHRQIHTPVHTYTEKTYVFKKEAKRKTNR